MAQTGTDGAQQPTPGNLLSLFKVNFQYLKDCSFESPLSPQVFFQKFSKPQQLKVSVDVVVNKLQDSLFEVILNFNVSAELDGEVHYIVEVKYAGIAATADSVAKETELEKEVLLVGVPTMLFSFARSVIANLTRDGGFIALLIDPIDFAALYKERNTNASGEDAQPPADPPTAQ